jgi:predicted RNA-binding Zn ribbon-like protein
MALPADPRPLTGEPLALDLLNTEWMRDGAVADLLEQPDGLPIWLAGAGLDDDQAGPATRDALVEARAAIRAVVSGGGVPAVRRLNRVLDHGRVRLKLADDGTPEQAIEVDLPSWRPAVLAAHNLVELLQTAPGRIRRCDHPHCVLWFLDTTRNGTRRWHSMAACGNRAKAQRHYERTKHGD